MKSTRDLLGANLTRLRESKKLTQAQLAEASDLSLKMVQKLEYGQTNPSADTLDRLVRALRCHPADLFSDRSTQPAVEAQLEAIHVLQSFLAGKPAVIVGEPQASLFKEVMQQFTEANTKGYADLWERIGEMTFKEQNQLREYLGMKILSKLPPQSPKR